MSEVLLLVGLPHSALAAKMDQHTARQDTAMGHCISVGLGSG